MNAATELRVHKLEQWAVCVAGVGWCAPSRVCVAATFFSCVLQFLYFRHPHHVNFHMFVRLYTPLGFALVYPPAPLESTAIFNLSLF